MYNIKNLLRKNKWVEVKDKDLVGQTRFYKVSEGILFDVVWMNDIHIIITMVDTQCETEKQKILVVFSGIPQSKSDFLTIIRCISTELYRSLIK